MSEDRKIIKKYEIVLGWIALLIIGYLVVNKYGCFLVKKAETEVTWTDGSSHDNLKPTNRKSQNDRQTEIEAEAAVRELAEIFANRKQKNDTKNEADLKRIGLNSDERDYYKELRKNVDFDENINSWFSLLKAASNTYQTVSDIFEKEKPQEGDDFYQALEDEFGIPRALSKEFAKRGKEKVSDWALFVEENK